MADDELEDELDAGVPLKDEDEDDAPLLGDDEEDEDELSEDALGKSGFGIEEDPEAI